ncbi:MAG: GNAT family protein [Candidatus Obscuribacterales bacterium]|nr:GNAT family protein [Candidatus Obscuribacterales bacterium]
MRLVLNFENPNIRNVVVRSYAVGDAESLVQHANNKKVWLNMRDRFPHPYELSDAEAWIKIATTNVEGECNLAIAIDDKVVGGVGITPQTDVHSKTAEFGYWLGEEHWGKGIMSTVVNQISEYFFENFDLVRLYATVFAWNPASAKVLEKCGWAFEGRSRKSVFKDGKYCDQLLFAKIKGECN